MNVFALFINSVLLLLLLASWYDLYLYTASRVDKRVTENGGRTRNRP